MKNIFYLPLSILLFVAVANAQDKTNIRIIIVDEQSGNLITDAQVKFVILSDNYGSGPDHIFNKGVYALEYPTNKTIKYTIISDKYYLPRQLIGEYNVINGNANIHTIHLRSASEKDLIIKGRVKNEAKKGVSGALVTLDIESSRGYKNTVTDSLGLFQIIIENGMKYVGSKFKVTLSYSTYTSTDIESVIQNANVNHLGDLQLLKSTSPAKTGLIEFLGPKRALNSIYLRSCCFATSELKPGLWRLTSNTDSISDTIQIKLNCRDCVVDSLTVRPVDFIDKVRVIDISSIVSYAPETIRIGLNIGNQLLLGADLQERNSWLVHFALAKSFFVFKRWFEAEAKVRVWKKKSYVESKKYTTLPGNEGVALNSFDLSAWLQFRIRHFFSDPHARLPSYYVGINGGFYRQVFRSVASMDLILEDSQADAFFRPGANCGIRYNLNKSISLYGEFSAEHLRQKSIDYQFNYFGRADQITGYKNQLGLALNASICLNL